MTFNGFYTDGWWWTGSATGSKEFRFRPPVNVLAFGALTAVQTVGGGSQTVPNTAYVGIIEVATPLH